MLGLLYFTLCSFGLTSILVYGKILDRIRPKHCFFHCPACMGFWVGAFLFCVNGYTELFTFDYNLINALLLGWLSSGTSYVLSTLFDDNGLKVNFGGQG
jgi:hypothetical protein